jgi:integrase
MADGLPPVAPGRRSDGHKQRTQRGGGANGFKAVAREFHAAKAPEWGGPHAKRWVERLEKDVFPCLGALELPDITARMLLDALCRVEARGVRETGRSIHQACGQVFRHGIRTDRTDRNPAATLRGALKPVMVENMAALAEPRAVGDLMCAILDDQGTLLARGALMRSALLFQRPGNVRAMKWSALDVDNEAPAWTIPAAEMKRSRYEKQNGRPHLVPLPPQAIAIRRELHPVSGRGACMCFPRFSAAAGR